MTALRVLHIDRNHPVLLEGLQGLGMINEEDYSSDAVRIAAKINQYDGLILRSRIPVDGELLRKATRLKFIGRVGAGLENIDMDLTKALSIQVFNAPEGNRNAVGEHALGMLLALFNKLHLCDRSVRQGQWLREEHRGLELDGKTVGIIGYGNTGKAFAKKLRGFEVRVLCHDILPDRGDHNAEQVSLQVLLDHSDVLSLHTPQSPETIGMVNTDFIYSFAKPFWLINTARGQSVITRDLIQAIDAGKVLGAALDVLDFEKTSFERIALENAASKNPLLQRLLMIDQVLLSPHVAGWTVESHRKLAQTIVDKIGAGRFERIG